MKVTRGKFITFEGPEGSGKSTHASLLRERLLGDGYSVLLTREPGGTPLGETVRNLLQRETASASPCSEAEFFLFMASRAQLVRQVIQPALAAGTHVICDRFADSTCAYQGGGRGLAMEQILFINNLATGGLQPDLTLLLDVPLEIGMERLHSRNAGDSARCDRIEKESSAFHVRVRNAFLELARRQPCRIIRVDAVRPLAEVQAEVWRVVQRVLD